MIVLTTAQRIKIDGVVFMVGPESFGAFLGSMAKSDEMAAQYGFDKQLKNLASTHLDLINRVEAWEGVVLPGGNNEPAPCTLENKLTLFGMRPDMLVKLSRRVAGLEEEEQKNSEAPQDGSQGITPEPAPIAATS